MIRHALALSAALAASSISPAAQPPRAGDLYVAVPASDSNHEVPSILVFDSANQHRFVRRIDLTKPELVRSLAAHRATNRLYLTTVSRLVALDLATEKVVWQKSYDGHCCDRPDVSPDGATIYAPAFQRPVWYVIDAADGRLMTSVQVAGWPRQTIFSRDGTRAYLVAWESKTIAVADANTHRVIREIGPFSDFVCPVAIDHGAALAFATVDHLVGFEVADLQTGLVTDRVIVENVDAADVSRYECPSHGIAVMPGGREVWLADGVANRIHVFNATTYPPEAVAAIQLRSQPRSVTFSSDGRFAYAATQVIDTRTRKVVATLQDDHGNPVRSDVAAVIDR